MTRAFLLLLLLYVGWCIPRDAHAQTAASCTTVADECTKEQAYLAARLIAQDMGAQYCPNRYVNGEPASMSGQSVEPNPGDPERSWDGFYHCTDGSRNKGGTRYYTIGCPADKPWNEATKTCGDPCAEKKGQRVGRGIVKGSMLGCSGGCELKATAGVQVCVGEGSEMVCGGGAESWEYSGNSCSVEKQPAPEECVPITGQTLCMKPDGSKCVTASTGRQICFGNGETGTKTDGSTLVQAGAGPNAPAPPGPTPGNDTLHQTGGPTTVTTTNTTTNVTNVVNISTWGTTHGTNAGSINQGGNTGGTSSTPGGGSNTGGTGGNGGDGGDGGDGSCEGEDCEDGPGEPGAGVGDLYEGTGRTVSDVYGEFKGRLNNTALVSAVSGFFGGCALGGSCPTWSYDGGEMMGALSFDALCNGALQTLLSYGSAIVLAIAAFAAFRIAIY